MGEWAVIANDTSISFDFTSPVFNDTGDFSYPFKLPVAQNVHFLKNIADPNGVVDLKKIHAKSAEIWFDGVQISSGKIEISDSIDFSSDNIEINVVAKQGEFNDLIDDLSCQDVPMRDKILLGNKISKVNMSGGTGFKDSLGNFHEADKTKHLDMVDFNCKYFKYNIQEAYPDAYYCNIDICCSKADEDGYALLPYYRLDTSPCFYVLYFLDCLFCHLDINFDKSDFFADKYPDFKRLAFVNFKAQFDEDKENTYSVPYKSTKVPDHQSDGHFYYPFEMEAIDQMRFYDYESIQPQEEDEWILQTRTIRRTVESVDMAYCYANPKNFPDQQVSDIIKDLKNAFGIKLNFSPRENSIRLFLLKDVFNDNEILTLDCQIIESPFISRTMQYGTILTYGSSEDTQYSYTMPDGTVSAQYGTYEAKKLSMGIIFHNDFSSILSMTRSKTDNNTHYDLSTGNAYRIKVDKDTGDNPQLFEVGAYVPFKQNVTDEDKAEKIEIKFQPVNVNDVYEYVKKTRNNSDRQQMLKVFSSQEMYAKEKNIQLYDASDKKKGDKFSLPTATGIMIDDKGVKVSDFDNDKDRRIYASVTVNGYNIKDISQSSDSSSDGTPIETETEYMLGFMRGSRKPHSDFSVVKDYDGEGNSSWQNNAQEYAFTPDSVDSFGNQYSYDSDYKSRLSLRLDARKVKKYDDDGTPQYYEANKDLGDRGLVQQLLAEYLYFKEHKAKITFSVKMSLVSLLNINYLKRYKIGNYIGFINKVSFSLSDDGISNCKIEMYCLNK